MFEYKKYVKNLLEDNKELVKEYAIKAGILKEEPEDVYVDLESRCYRVLAEYGRLIIYGIDGPAHYLKKLYELFKDDIRVQFWLEDSLKNVLPIDSENIWLKNNDFPNRYPKSIFDYGDYRLLEKAHNVKELILINDDNKRDESLGFLPGDKKEKNLCKAVSKFIKQEKEIVVMTYDEKTLLFLKGLMSGSQASNRTLTFAFLEGYQNHLIKLFSNEMYSVAPVITVEEDANWNVLKRKWCSYQKEILEEVKKAQLNK
ncbi:hypothetical protein [Priestia aryabhattai]